MGLNLLLIIPGVLVANTPLWIVYPYCYSGYAVSYTHLSVALWKNGKTDRNNVHRNATCTGKIAQRKNRNCRKHRKQGRQFIDVYKRQLGAWGV